MEPRGSKRPCAQRDGAAELQGLGAPARDQATAALLRGSFAPSKCVAIQSPGCSLVASRAPWGLQAERFSLFALLWLRNWAPGTRTRLVASTRGRSSGAWGRDAALDEAAEIDLLSRVQDDGMSTLAAYQRQTMLVSEDSAANPDGGIYEDVPATVVAPVPGPPDFNGASAVVARLPNLGAYHCPAKHSSCE